MEVPELNLKECASVFVRDDFYESIQAPKFHDFCSSFEEDSGDIDAFFRKSGGTIKATRQFEGACLDPNLVKVQKDIIFPKSADFEGCQSGSPALIPDDYSTVEKASVCGSKKARSAIPSTTLTKGQDKVPIKGKTLKKANIPCNAPIPSTASDRSSSDSSQQLSAAEYHPPSENEDPNPASALRKRATRVISKSKAPPSMSSSVYAASQCLFERKRTSETMVLDVQFLESISNDSVGIDSAIKEQVLINASQYEASDVKGRKRKSSGRNLDGLVSKALEAQQSFKGRVSKVSRKVLVSVDTESCSDSKEVSTFSSRPASQPKGTARSSFSASSTLAPALTKKSSASPKVRRNSDQSRRRKSSSSASARTRRQNVPKGPSTEGTERTRGNPSQEGVSTMSSQASCSNGVSSSGGKKRDAGHDSNGMLELLRKVSSLSWTGEVSAPNSTIQEQEIVAHIFTNASQEGRPSVNQADCDVEKGDQAHSVERRQNSQYHEQDEPQLSRGEPRSGGELLSGQLQKLHLKQGRESMSEKCAEAHESRGRFNESGCHQLAGLEVCEPMSFGHDVHDERCIQESNESKRKPEVKDELEKVGILVDNFKGLDEYETNSSVSYVDIVEQGKKSGVSNECQAEERPIDALEDSQTRLCFEFSKLGGCKVITADSKIDDADQAALLEQLQNLRLPRGDESHDSGEPIQKVTATLLSCSYSASSETKDESLSSASTSDIGKERKVNIIQTCISDSASFSKKEKQYRAIEGTNVRGAQNAKPCVLKQNKKRKSTDMIAHKSDLGLLNTMVAPNADEQQTAKLAVQSSAVGSLQPPAPSTVKSAPLSAAGQQKKMKTTCPQPFRLRTQERGALKEVEFNKKVEQYLAAKEKAPFTPLACETMKVTKKPPKAPSKESKWPVRPVQQSRSRAAAAACSAQLMQQEEEEIKKMRKKMVPHSQKMPSFDRPFKPHRSTKSPTIPSSPNFQRKMKKTTATLAPIHD